MNKKIIDIYQSDNLNNVGDTISVPILENLFDIKTRKVSNSSKGKLIAVGSIISWAAKENDTIWGSGLIKDQEYTLNKKCKILALRGKLSQKKLKVKCEVFSDPAILLPLIYNPEIEKKAKLGIVEHYIDKGLYHGEGLKINVQQNWQLFINQIKSCEFIYSSSLHGLVIAEAYGIPCRQIKLSSKVVGGDFKFQDYLSASNRKQFGHFDNIEEYQNKLIKIFEETYLA